MGGTCFSTAPRLAARSLPCKTDGFTLARAPGFTAIAVLAVALGIGANSSIFTFINAYLLRPLPHPDSDRMVILAFISQPDKRVLRDATSDDLAAWQRHARSFEDLVPFRFAVFNFSGAERPEVVRGIAASASLSRMLRVTPQLGRTFLPEEDRAGGPRSS